MKRIVPALALLFLGISCVAAAPTQTAMRREAPACGLVFGRDGQRLFSSGYGEIVERDGRTARVVRRHPIGIQRVQSLSLTLDGTKLLAAGGSPGESGALYVVDAASGRVVDRLPIGEDVLTSVSPVGKNGIALACADRFMRWTREGSRSFERLGVHSAPILGLAVSPDTSLIVTCGADRTIRVYDFPERRLRVALTNHTDTVNAIAFRPGDSGQAVLASASDDGTVRIWQPAIGRMVRIIRGHKKAVLAVTYSPDGRRLFSAGAEGIVREIDPDSDRIVREHRVTSHWIQSLEVSPDNSRLAAGDSAGRVFIIPLAK